MSQASRLNPLESGASATSLPAPNTLPSPKPPGVEAKSAFSEILSELSQTWSGVEKKSKSLMADVPKEFKALLDAQMSVHAVHLQTELITKAIDGAQSTLKRLQQGGA